MKLFKKSMSAKLNEAELEMVVQGIEYYLDDPQGDFSNYQEMQAFRDTIQKFLDGGDEQVWRQGNSPFKMVSPNGQTFNLRVDDEREAFFRALNDKADASGSN